MNEVYRVTPDCLIPRPETELLVLEAEKALRDFASAYRDENAAFSDASAGLNDRAASAAADGPDRPLRVLDLCTGSGCVAVSLLKRCGNITADALDISAPAAALCAEKDILMVVDEVQTGMGRTGTLFAYEQFGIHPDIVSTAKGIAGGLPMGACLLGDKLQDTLSAGTHGSTFGGNPVCAAGALNILNRIDDTLLADVRRKSARLIQAISAMRGVKSVSGMGLMLGIETEAPAIDVVNRGIERGVLMLTAKSKVRLLPALTITDAELDEALRAMADALDCR